MNTTVEKEKKGFLLYADLDSTVQKLTNDQAGELFKMILLFVNDKNPTSENTIVDLVFGIIKQQLKRDLDKWEQKSEARKKAGAEGGRASAEARKKAAVKKKANNQENKNESQGVKQKNEANQPIAYLDSNHQLNQDSQSKISHQKIQSVEANQPDIDSDIDSDNVSDNDSDNVSDNVNAKEKENVSDSVIETKNHDLLNGVDDLYEENNLPLNQDALLIQKLEDENLLNNIVMMFENWRQGKKASYDDRSLLKIILNDILEAKLEKGELAQDDNSVYKIFDQLMEASPENKENDMNSYFKNWSEDLDLILGVYQN